MQEETKETIMNRITLDTELRAKLNGLNERVEVCDEAGRTVGHFVPTAMFDEMARTWKEADLSDEELQRRFQEPGGRSLKEIWQRLGRQ